MTPNFTYQTYPKRLSSIYEVCMSMDKLQKELQDTDMHNLRAFNQTYRIITNAVIKKMGTGYFQNDSMMQKIDIQFAWYYFRALKNFVDQKHVEPAWEILFVKCKANDLNQFAYMALGVNAHVNNDLAFTLKDAKAGPKEKRDYDLINNILNEKIKEVFVTLTEESAIVNNLENISIPLYRPVLHNLIKKWRSDAWNSFLMLKNRRIENEKIEQNARRMALVLSLFKKPKHLLN